MNNLIDNIFPVNETRRLVPASYQNIYNNFVSMKEHYNFSLFMEKMKCLQKIYYDYHSTFLEIKWWAKDDLHKSGLIWGNFDLQLGSCSKNSLKN